MAILTSFEEYASTQMLGHLDSPPRSDSKLVFSEPWQRTVFGMAMALSKDGYFEWEDFRRHLIRLIADWEGQACKGINTYDYYAHYTGALIAVLEEQGIVAPGALGIGQHPHSP